MLRKRQNQTNLVYLPVSTKGNTQLAMSSTIASDSKNKPWQAEMLAIAETQDRVAYKSLYLHFAPKVSAFFVQQGLADKAEELTHEVFIKIWQKAKTYNPSKAQVSTWIFTIVRNLRIDFLRKKKLDEVSSDEDNIASDSDNIEKVIELKRSRSKLLSIFKSLNEEQRNVLQKVYFEDKSHQAAADELEMTPGVVKSRIRSALKIMRSQMGGKKL